MDSSCNPFATQSLPGKTDSAAGSPGFVSGIQEGVSATEISMDFMFKQSDQNNCVVDFLGRRGGGLFKCEGKSYIL